jgi:hypothetical protein
LVKTPLNESPFKNAILASTILKCLNIGAHIGFYDHYVDTAKEEKKTNVCFEPPCGYYN